jgi:hypothetical protein
MHVLMTSTTGQATISRYQTASLGGPEARRDRLAAASTIYTPIVYGNYMAALAVIQAIRSTDGSLFVNQTTPLVAVECALIPCVIKYKQSTVANSGLFAKHGVNIVPYDEIAERIYDDIVLIDSAPTIQIPHDTSHDDPTTYQMSEVGYRGLKSYLQAMFVGFQTTDGNEIAFEGDNTTSPLKINTMDVIQSLLSMGGWRLLRYIWCYIERPNFLYNSGHSDGHNQDNSGCHFQRIRLQSVRRNRRYMVSKTHGRCGLALDHTYRGIVVALCDTSFRHHLEGS